MNIEKAIVLIKRIIVKIWGANFNISFSQTGEDIIMLFIFNSFKIKKITYLDIGTNHPFNLNNTYLFYLLGLNGVCVEPDPSLFEKIKKNRKRDVCINVGIGIGNQKEGQFYLMSNSVFNTFSEEEARKLEFNKDASIIKTINMPLNSINDIINSNFSTCPDIISLDVEGIDLQILQELNFSKYRPKVFCIETISYSSNLNGTKAEGILELMKQNNYRIFADTYINTIFVDNNFLKV